MASRPFGFSFYQSEELIGPAVDGGHPVGTLDLSTGLITHFVNDLSNPGGLAFADTSKHGRDGDRDQGHDFDGCRERECDFR